MTDKDARSLSKKNLVRIIALPVDPILPFRRTAAVAPAAAALALLTSKSLWSLIEPMIPPPLERG